MSAHLPIARSERPLLHICHAPADHGWVHGRMLPALGLTVEQVRTRADDARAWFERSLALNTSLAEANPTDAGLQRDLLISRRDLARTAAVGPGAGPFHSERAAIGFDRSHRTNTLAGDAELAAMSPRVTAMRR